ncbi:MAG: glycoside hydrolase family 127 protein [Candidatus Marinimicrobia bacterium]|nr:glycoside hydrolase family 127 protein [Candidatus Neomarinimicrobiota bacterium]
MKIKSLIIIILIVNSCLNLFAQEKSLVNTYHSKYARVFPVEMDDVELKGGFWGHWFDICRDSMITHMWKIYSDPEMAHAYQNFRIAAGLDTGHFKGPPFNDGDFYKMLEAMASVYAKTKDSYLDSLMDTIISIIGLVQREDGYIHTPALIEQINHPDKKPEFKNRINFETYNLGHLITAAIVHYRATGKTTMLQIAEKAAMFLYNFYKNYPVDFAKSTICPSHYMGITELYRTTGNPVYLELAKGLIEIRNLVGDEGTDQNQDRIPFKKQRKAVGHAVRANYLYAGVADIYAETGDDSLFIALNSIWNDIDKHKLYITGGCGALYDGVSPDGTTYNPSEIQQVHQAYGREYQLPNITAHNETCANIGYVLWNWRMFLITGNARYIDKLELAIYNSVLSGVSLNGKRYFYTNPLCVVNNLPFTLRWSKVREEFISLSNCCPPNLLRTIAEIYNYIYARDDSSVWINLYNNSELSVRLNNNKEIKLKQVTGFPWDGKVTVKITKASGGKIPIKIRIPGWSDETIIKLNGKKYNTIIKTQPFYYTVSREWKEGDKIDIYFDVSPKIIVANPLVEEDAGKGAIKAGPIVYCLESPDLPDNVNILDVHIRAKMKFQTEYITIENFKIKALKGKVKIIQNIPHDKLYDNIKQPIVKNATVRFIPYFAWQNRGKSEMTVWMPIDY